MIAPEPLRPPTPYGVVMHYPNTAFAARLDLAEKKCICVLKHRTQPDLLIELNGKPHVVDAFASRCKTEYGWTVVYNHKGIPVGKAKDAELG